MNEKELSDHLSRFTILRDFPREETPFNVDSYPYGRLRAKVKYWVETTKKGDRLVFQSQNPKTLKWNKPKKSTYSPVLVVGVERTTGHFKQVLSISHYSNETSELYYNSVKDLVNFNDLQKAQIKQAIAINKVMSKVKFECVSRKFRHKITGEITESVPIFSMSDYEEVGNENGQSDREQENAHKRINQAIGYEITQTQI